MRIQRKSQVHIDVAFFFGTRMGYRTEPRRADEFREFPDGATGIDRFARTLPTGFAGLKFGVRQIDAQVALDRVNRNDIAVLQHRDRAAMGCLGAHMAHAEPTGRAAEPAIGDQRDLFAHALTGQGRSGRQHFAHSRAARRALIADHQHFAFFVCTLFHGLERVFFAFKHARRAAKDLLFCGHPGDFDDRTIGGKVAA